MPKKRFTPLKTFILGVMNTYNEKNMSGYELIKLSREWRYEHYIKSTKASFYYALKQLERENCIKVIGSKRSKNRPDQTIYKLTPKGRKEFNQQMIKNTQHGDVLVIAFSSVEGVIEEDADE